MLFEYLIFGVAAFLLTGAQCEDTEVFAEAGSQAVLPCKCISSRSYSPSISWTKVNSGTVWKKQRSGLQHWGSSWYPKGLQRARCPHTQFERGDCSLEINNVREEDGGLYSCKVESGSRIFENVISLRIIKVSVSQPVAIWGNKVSVTCNVTPWPNGARVQWMLNSSPFVPLTGIPSADTAESVVMQRATEKLTGNWTCIVGYKGNEGRASATLTVKGIIQPSKDNTKVYAAVGSEVTLPCVFSSGLIPSSFVWEKLKPGSGFNKPAPGRLPASFSRSSPSTQPSLDNSARLKEVGFEDEGRYRCSGIVEEQRLTRNIQIVVAKIESSITSKKKGSMMLTCQLTDTSEVTDYEWVHVVYDINGTQSFESVQKGKTLSISKVSEEDRGEWTCRFFGKEGILGNVTYQVQLMSGLSGQKSSSFSHNTAAVVGLSILLVVLLLILVQMYKNHQRRKRIFQYPALETIVHTTSNEREERERNREKK